MAQMGTPRFKEFQQSAEQDFIACVDFREEKPRNFEAEKDVVTVRLNLRFPGCYPSRRIGRGSGEIGRRARLRGV